MRSKGTSLIEVIVAMGILAIAVTGALIHRYYATLNTKEAVAHITSARISTLLCESWGGVKGSDTYEPVSHLGSELQISPVTGIGEPEHFGDFTPLGIYEISLDESKYYIALAWKDIVVGLRALNVVVAHKYSSTMLEGGSTGYAFQWSDDDNNLFKLTTYVTTE